MEEVRIPVRGVRGIAKLKGAESRGKGGSPGDMASLCPHHYFIIPCERRQESL